MSVTKDEVSDLIKANNDQFMAPFQDLLKDTAGQIRRGNETSAGDEEIKISRTAQV